MTSNIERGKLLFSEQYEIYKRNILFGKIMFYFFIFLPVFLTIFYIILIGKLSNILIPIWIISFIVSFFVFSSKAFAKNLTVYENGFVPSLIPIKMRFKKEDPFIRFDDIDKVALIIPKTDKRKIQIIGITRKDGIIVGAEKGFVDETTLIKFANILREKVKDKVKEDFKAGI